MTQSPEAQFDPDRETLRALLWDACELEQQLMLQYLFAAFTLKKFPDAHCTPAQLEAMRRWGSTVMLVARQEMEHLALANGILAAIGEDPFFARDNIPSQTPYLLGENRVEARDEDEPPAAAKKKKKPVGPTPLDIPFVWEKFNVPTMRRFVCAESPDWEHVEGTDMYPYWCFADDSPKKGGLLRSAALGPTGLPPSRSHLDRTAPPAPEGLLGSVPVHPGTIPTLYGKIQKLLKKHPEYFVGQPDRQVFVPVEYQISILKITDYASAKKAIHQIIEEGEGIDAPPDYDSHFARFFKVHTELEELVADPGFDPALPVHENPIPDRKWLDYTREVSEVFDYAYVTLLYVLTSLYRNYARRERSPFLTEALQNVAFGPFMTMVIRPIAEVLVHLRIHKGKDSPTAGPAFRLTAEEEQVIWPRPPAAGPPGSTVSLEVRQRMAAQLDNIDFILDRLDELVARLGRLAGGEDGKPPRALKAALVSSARPEWAREQLDYVRESAQAMANNVRRIYQIGELPQFTVPVEWPK